LADNLQHKIYPIGDSALTIEFGKEISDALNSKSHALSDAIESNPFIGFVECVPAYASVTVFYDIGSVVSAYADHDSAYSAAAQFVSKTAEQIVGTKTLEKQTVSIPVDFSKKHAPDLKFVADHNQLTVEEVIAIFLERSYRVFMLGFLPGFPYLGRLDQRIAAPRLDKPRIHVPKGSVGIAGRQTGIYPLESPGGWRIIGRTETELFPGDEDSPTLFGPGDLVTFEEI
jgi:inhibitor of KinA